MEHDNVDVTDDADSTDNCVTYFVYGCRIGDEDVDIISMYANTTPDAGKVDCHLLANSWASTKHLAVYIDCI